MSFYEEMVEMANEQLKEYGRTVILRRNNEGEYDPSTDDFSGGNTADENVKVLFTEYSQKEIDGTIILRGDKKILIADHALNVPPQHNDIIVDGDDEYKVIQVSTVQPGEVALIYKLQVRK